MLTLVIFAKSSDGYIIISDRKEDITFGRGNDIPKYFLSPNNDFYLVFAGNGLLPKSLYSHLEQSSSSINANNVWLETQNHISGSFSMFSKNIEARGFLVVKENMGFKVYICEILDNVSPIKRPIDGNFFAIGDSQGIIKAEHLLKGVILSEMNAQDASRHLIAVLREVAETTDSVGKLGSDFGYDITAFMNSGKILQRKKYTDTDSEEIQINYIIRGTKTILEEIENSGGN